MKAGVYLRVSTEKQDAENQLPDLLKLCAARGWEADVRQEVESGKKARPVLDALCADAHRGKVGAVVVWKLDRLGRNKLEASVRIARLLEIPKLHLCSYQETWIEQPSAVRSLMVDIFTWQAEDEHRNIVERTNIGLAKARAKLEKGQRIGPEGDKTAFGRPRVEAAKLAAAAAECELARGTYFNAGKMVWRAKGGGTLAGVARRHDISESTLRRHLRGAAESVKKGD